MQQLSGLPLSLTMAYPLFLFQLLHLNDHKTLKNFRIYPAFRFLIMCRSLGS